VIETPGNDSGLAEIDGVLPAHPVAHFGYVARWRISRERVHAKALVRAEHRIQSRKALAAPAQRFRVRELLNYFVN
jgi:acyl-coenzyme A synthetase/AMP-(fatty) acid ligase